jgi:hypothetical protein
MSSNRNNEVLVVDSSIKATPFNKLSASSLEELESSHMGMLEDTLQEMMTPAESRQYGMTTSKSGRHFTKSPTESWSVMSEGGNGNLNELREELHKADSVYSRKTEDESISPSVVEGVFRPISHPDEEEKQANPHTLSYVIEPSPIKHTKSTASAASKQKRGNTAKSSSQIPHEVYVVSPTSQQQEEQDDTEGSFSLSQTPAKTATPRPPFVRGWASVTELKNTPTFVRRHSSVIDSGRSPGSYLRSAQSPVQELLHKQEQKRKHLKESINAVKTQNMSLDQTLQSTLAERDQLSKDYDDERQAHQELLSAKEDKIKFLQRQHAHQQEQQLGVLKLTRNHNMFLKDQLEELQDDYIQLQTNHEEDLAKVLEKPKALHQQIFLLQQSKAQLQSHHRAALSAQQRTYESLEVQRNHLQQERILLEAEYQCQLQDEQSKAKMLKEQLSELESTQLATAQQQAEALQSQLADSTLEQTQLIAQHQIELQQEQDEYAALEKQHASVLGESEQLTLLLNQQLSEVQATCQRLESELPKQQNQKQRLQQQLLASQQQEQETRAKWDRLQENKDKLECSLQTIQEERDELVNQQQEQTALQQTMKESFLQKVSVLETECSRLQTTQETEIDRQGKHISGLAAHLEQSKSQQQAQQDENLALREELAAMKQAQEELIAQHDQELEVTKDANVNLVRDLAKELGFGL